MPSPAPDQNEIQSEIDPCFEQPALKAQVVERAGWEKKYDFQLAQSVLLLYQDGQRAIGIRSNNFAWKFVARAGCFDYFPAGKYDAYISGPESIRGVKVEIPAAFETCILELGRWSAELSARFQFRDRRLERLVQSLVKTAANKPVPQDALLLSVALVDRLYETARPFAATKRHLMFTNTVRQLIRKCVDQSFEASIDTDRVAFLTGLGRTQFGKVFRNSFEMPLHQYVLARKVHIATRRLLEDVAVTDLSHELGFSSHAHFSTVFRKHVGLTPSEFRKHRIADVSASFD